MQALWNSKNKWKVQRRLGYRADRFKGKFTKQSRSTHSSWKLIIICWECRPRRRWINAGTFRIIVMGLRRLWKELWSYYRGLKDHFRLRRGSIIHSSRVYRQRCYLNQLLISTSARQTLVSKNIRHNSLTRKTLKLLKSSRKCNFSFHLPVTKTRTKKMSSLMWLTKKNSKK